MPPSSRFLPALRVALTLAMTAALTVMTLPLRADAIETGYVGPTYSGTTAPTGEKPQSKLWFADGQWWGVLWDGQSQDFHIFRFDWAGNTWHDTGVLVDERSSGRVDTLWDGDSLYVASAGTNSSSATHSPRVTKFTYDTSTDTWAKAGGFPVTVGNGGVEAAVLTKDSTGLLWATYTQGAKVWVAHSVAGDERTWVTPYILPTSAGTASVSPDDISAIVSFDGDKVGVLWSNQVTMKMYWASHVDGTADREWTTEVVYDHPEGADDHINLKSMVGDPAGRVFAVLKTSFDKPDDALVNLLVLDRAGNWSTHVFARKADDLTRATVLLDSENRHVYVFASGPCCSGGKIYYKRASLDDPQFEPGVGAVFMENSLHPEINNPTSTKQNLSSSTGLLVLASDDETRTYVYNRLTLGSGPAPDTQPPETAIVSAPPASTTDTTAEFAFSSSEAGSTFRCALDGSSYVDCTSPVTYNGLAQGEHTFSVAATDPSGNEDSTPAEHTWTVDPAAEPPALFSDDFGSGGFTAGGWDVLVGGDGTATVVDGAVRPGDLGARLVSSTATGSTASVRKVLDANQMSLEVAFDASFAIAGKTDQTYAVLKLYDSGGSRVLTLSRSANTGQLTVLGKAGSTTAAFAGPAVGEATRLTVRVTQDPNALDTVSVALGDTVVMTDQSVDLGSLALRRVRIGDDSLRRLMDLRVDNVEVRP